MLNDKCVEERRKHLAIKTRGLSRAWWHRPVILALGTGGRRIMSLKPAWDV
jgi:hypothetical protein